MSNISSIVLYSGHLKSITINYINHWIHQNYYENESLERIGLNCSTNKQIEMNIYGGGFNNFPLYDFIEFMKTIDWEGIQTVLLIRADQDVCIRRIILERSRHECWNEQDMSYIGL